MLRLAARGRGPRRDHPSTAPTSARRRVVAIRARHRRAARSRWCRSRPPRTLTIDSRFRLLGRAGDGAGDAQGGVPQPPAPAWWPRSRQAASRWSAWRPTTDRLLATGSAVAAGRRCCSARSSGSSSRSRIRMGVTVVNPLQFLRELFTVSGAGTLIRRGSRIDVRDGWQSRRPGAAARALRTRRSASDMRDDFFDDARSRAPYVEENYRGAAVVRRDGGGALPDQVRRRAPGPGRRPRRRALVGWSPATTRRSSGARARRTRSPPGTSSSATASLRFPKWHVFWRGLPVETIEPGGPATRSPPTATSIRAESR